MKKFSIPILVLFCIVPVAIAQTHTSVPLGSPAYMIIEQAEQRGLCVMQGSTKPYSREKVVAVLNEILLSADNLDGKQKVGSLTEQEREIILSLLESFEMTPGMDWQKGQFLYRRDVARNLPMSLNIGATWQSVLSVALGGSDSDFSYGTDNWATLFLRGDMGTAFSWAISGGGGFMRAPRKELGTYYPFYDGYDTSSGRENTPMTVYSQPLAFFPYTFTKYWDSSVFVTSNLSSSGFYEWPQGLAFGYNILSEMDVSLLDGHIFLRWGRILREAGGMSNGSSLFLNANARPFVALEGTFSPFDWLRFSALTGVLEYYNDEGVSTSAETFQNAFSLALVEVNYKNYVGVSFGSSAVWPKRFELGYLFPLNSNFFYQNNIGDFDNMAFAFNLFGGYPGVGKAWLSVFADEFDLSSPNFFHRDRNMYAWQIGVNTSVPVLSFGSFSVQYTKIEPYTYTHQRTKTPWYGDAWMETAYVNNGVCLGYYLPPNSDEVKVRFETMPVASTRVHLQYQMIRHGADWGSGAVDGSNLDSQLDPSGRNEKDELLKYFLHDGTYQWQHIVKIGGEYNISGLGVPVELFGDIGFVHTFFTGISGEANSGRSYPYHKIDTDEYPATTYAVATVGLRVFP